MSVAFRVVRVKSLDFFDKGGRGVGYILGRLDELFLGNGVVGLGGRYAARVAKSARVLGDYRSGREDLLLIAGRVAKYGTGLLNSLYENKIKRTLKTCQKTIQK